MPQLLTLRGRNALSPFRVAKLTCALAQSLPGHDIAGVAAATAFAFGFPQPTSTPGDATVTAPTPNPPPSW